MIHDVVSMSAGLVEGNKRTIVISFDRRINHEAVLAFANRSVADLIKSEGEGPEVGTLEKEPPPQTTQPFAVSRSLSSPAEREAACTIANKGLEDSNLDPDSDHVVLCRQYGRAIEKISRMSKILHGLLAESDERHSPIRGYTIGDLNRELSDHWPQPPDPKSELAQYLVGDAPPVPPFPLSSLPPHSTVLLIMPRNMGRVPEAPRGHSAVWAQADIVIEWEYGRWNIVKDLAR